MSTDDGEARLRRVLESVGSVYVDDDVGIDFDDELRVEIDDRRYTDGPAQEFVLPARTGEYLDADLTPDEEYELQLDTLNHLSYCRREDSWNRTESFVADTDRSEPLATFVHRMVEHAYVTAGRLSEYRGLTGAYARRMDAAFDDEARVDSLRQDEALLEGLREVAYTGQVAGLASAPENVRGALSFAATELDRVRDPGATADRRDEVATRILGTLASRMYRPRTAERYLRRDLDLPFQDTSTLFPGIEADDTDDDDSEDDDGDDPTAKGLVEWVVLAPIIPMVLISSWLGCDDALEDFYTPLPDGPYGIFLLLYPLLLPVFVVWGVARAGLGRLGYWDPLVERTTGYWNRLRAGTVPLRTGLSDASGRVTDWLGTRASNAADAVNARLPGDWTLDLESVVVGYVLLFNFPYLLGQRLFGEEPVDTFFWSVDGSEGLRFTLAIVFLPPLFALLFPVFLVWATTRAVALRLGVWERVTARARELWAPIAAVPERLRHAPAVIFGLVVALFALLVRWWHRTAYAVRSALRRLRGDDWRRDIPDTDDDRLREQLQNRAEAAPGRDDSPSSPEAAKSSPDSAAGDTTESEPQPEGGERAVDGSGRPDPGGAATADIEGQLLADAEHRSTSARGEVSLVTVEYETTEGTALDDALGELTTLDRRTASELQRRRADRDDRITTRGSADDVLAAVRDRGLDELIQRLFAQFPPEERRERRGETGHRLDLPTVARSAGGRLPNDGLFRQRRHTETGSRCVGVAIDLSSSMDGFEAKVALAALARAADLLGDDFVAVGFRGRDRSVPLVTGPTEPFEPAHLTSIEIGGSTPIAAGVRESRRLLKAADADEQVLLVITDGSPNVGLPDGDGAEADTRSEIERCRRDGIAVVGVGIDAGYGMASLFGDDAFVEVTDEQFADRLLEVYRDQHFRTQRR